MNYLFLQNIFHIRLSSLRTRHKFITITFKIFLFIIKNKKSHGLTLSRDRIETKKKEERINIDRHHSRQIRY